MPLSEVEIKKILKECQKELNSGEYESVESKFDLLCDITKRYEMFANKTENFWRLQDLLTIFERIEKYEVAMGIAHILDKVQSESLSPDPLHPFNKMYNLLCFKKQSLPKNEYNYCGTHRQILRDKYCPISNHELIHPKPPKGKEWGVSWVGVQNLGKIKWVRQEGRKMLEIVLQ